MCWTTSFLGLLLFITVSCVDAQYVQVDRELVNPTSVDSTDIDARAMNQHTVLLPAPGVTPTGYLLIWLAGSTGIPRFTSNIQDKAAKLGHHVIGVAYENAQAIGQLCGGNSNTTCQVAVRTETITGEDLSPLVNVTKNSIQERLQKLLYWLEQRNASQGWGQFLTSSNETDWSKVIVAGQSQGGGTAQILSYIYSVARVAAFAGVTTGVQQATTTPIDRYFGIVRYDDPDAGGARFVWVGLGWGGDTDVTNITSLSPPYGNAHILATDKYAAECAYNPHGCLTTDNGMPTLTDGTPIWFDEEWDYMFRMSASPPPSSLPVSSAAGSSPGASPGSSPGASPGSSPPGSSLPAGSSLPPTTAPPPTPSSQDASSDASVPPSQSVVGPSPSANPLGSASQAPLDPCATVDCESPLFCEDGACIDNSSPFLLPAVALLLAQ